MFFLILSYKEHITGLFCYLFSAHHRVTVHKRCVAGLKLRHRVQLIHLGLAFVSNLIVFL